MIKIKETQNYINVECEDCDYSNYQSIAKTKGFEFRYLGSFDVK